MYTSLAAVAFCIACVLSLMLIPGLSRLARRARLVDCPDGHRKLHRRAVPLAGGIAVFLATLAAVLVLTTSGTFRDLLSEAPGDLWGLLAAAAVLLCVGLVDDRFGLRGRQKLAGQVVACSVLLCSGLVFERVQVFDWRIELGLLSVPVTLLWLLAAINSMNLLDGINGLAGTIGLVNALALAAAALIGGHEPHAVVAAAFGGALLGFLRFNFPSASVFLGDAGSMLIGLVIGALSVQTSLKGPGTVLLAMPVCLLTIPFFDSAAAIVRRKLTGRSVFSTDRAHLHHRLSERHGSVRAVGIIGLCCGALAVAALYSVILRNEAVALVSCTAVVMIFVATRMFGHTELQLLAARMHSVGRSLLAVPQPQRDDASIQSAVRLQGHREWDLLWSSLTELAEELPLEHVELDVNAPSLREGYHAAWKRLSGRGEEHRWRVEMPLLVTGHKVGHIRMIGDRCEEAVNSEFEKVLALIESFEGRLQDLLADDAVTHAGASEVEVAPGLSHRQPALAVEEI
jgi:UDP-GlcNAc:undecaprenyl-phosphate GlcNAc-1-phosphate transferase